MFGWFRKAPPVPAPAAADWLARGNAALGQGDLPQAAQCYRQAAAADPSDPAAWLNLGFVLLEQGDPAAALRPLEQSVALARTRSDLLPDAQFLLGRARSRQGDGSDAILCFLAALSARPGFVEALQEAVPLLLAAGRAPEAVAVAQRAAAQAPAPDTLMLLAQSLHAAGRISDAVAQLQSLLALQPGDAGALGSLGNLLLEMGRAEEALAAHEQVLRIQGRDPDALANAAAALLRLDRPAEALALTEEALAMQGQHRVSLRNKVSALMDQLRLDEAMAVLEQASTAHPGDPDFQWGLAVGHLLRGEFRPGWQAHEARWRAEGFAAHQSAPVSSQAQWTGQVSLEGRSILLFAEQGLGDTIQFLRYVPLVARRAAQVLLQVPPALLPVLPDPGANCRVLRPGEPVPPHDLQCSLMSLPYAFGTTLADIPAQVPYLRADADRRARWAQRLESAPKPRVGIVWSGNPQHRNDRRRSIPLRMFRAVDPGTVQFVALQPQVRDSDREALAGWSGLLDAGPDLRDFAETAALIEALDLVVSVDTSVAHLAGALGKPVWMLLPYGPDWRWMLDRTDSPWYPTARLYRQEEAGDWGAVLARVRQDLGELAALR